MIEYNHRNIEKIDDDIDGDAGDEEEVLDNDATMMIAAAL